jgi:hypothetical protein
LPIITIVLTRLTWAIAGAITKTFNHVVHQGVLKQTIGHWFFSNAIFVAITLLVNLLGLWGV